MRKLTAEQKKRLKQEWKNLINKGIEFPRVWEIDDNTFNNICNICPNEDVYANTERFFDDLNETLQVESVEQVAVYEFSFYEDRETGELIELED